ncbi:hypothetical protein [Natronomonas amylolytica]|uniref:hypothetical protein n=1 Tax=Natronomonas amylolytica TaxID=3108498 RepID=UPI0030089F64
MNSVEDIGETTISAILSLIVVGAVFNWAAEHDLGGPLFFILEPLGAVAAFVLDPSLVLILIAVGFIWSALSGDGF